MRAAAPVSAGLVLDFCNSMAPRFGRLQQAVAEFLKSVNPPDEFSLIEFRDRADLSMGFTGAPEEIQNRVASANPGGTTALLDAVYLGLRQMRNASDRDWALRWPRSIRPVGRTRSAERAYGSSWWTLLSRRRSDGSCGISSCSAMCRTIGGATAGTGISR